MVFFLMVLLFVIIKENKIWNLTLHLIHTKVVTEQSFFRGKLVAITAGNLISLPRLIRVPKLTRLILAPNHPFSLLLKGEIQLFTKRLCPVKLCNKSKISKIVIKKYPSSRYQKLNHHSQFHRSRVR